MKDLFSYLRDNTFIKWLKINYAAYTKDNRNLSLNGIITNLRRMKFSDDRIIKLGTASWCLSGLDFI